VHGNNQEQNPSKVERQRYAVNHADDVYRLLNPKQKVSSNQEMSYD
jgi:hypothetical protein